MGSLGNLQLGSTYSKQGLQLKFSKCIFFFWKSSWARLGEPLVTNPVTRLSRKWPAPNSVTIRHKTIPSSPFVLWNVSLDKQNKQNSLSQQFRRNMDQHFKTPNQLVLFLFLYLSIQPPKTIYMYKGYKRGMLLRVGQTTIPTVEIRCGIITRNEWKKFWCKLTEVVRLIRACVWLLTFTFLLIPSNSCSLYFVRLHMAYCFLCCV